MKKLGLVGGFLAIIVIVIAIVTAGQMGKTAPAFVRGKVVLSDDLIDAARHTKVLFLTVFDQERPFPPYGAFRKTVGDNLEGEIFEFILTYDNLQRMREDLPWPQVFRVKARLDVDGQGGRDQPGDLIGEVAQLNHGDTDVVIKIDRKM